MSDEEKLLVGLLLILVLFLIWQGHKDGFMKVPPKGQRKDRFENGSSPLAYYKKRFPSASKSNPVVVFHGTAWCHFCKEFKPEWAMIKQNGPAHIKFVEIDGDRERAPGVSGFPTLVKFDGATVSTFSGNRNSNSVLLWAKN